MVRKRKKLLREKSKLKQKLISYCVLIVVLFTLSFSPVQVSKANAWTAFAANGFKQMLEVIKYNINGMILGMLKKQAVSSLNSQIDSLIGGSNGSSPAFITNWQNYLVDQPKATTQTYINDYLSQMTNGKGTATGYTSEGFAGNGSYLVELKQNSLAHINTSNTTTVPKVTYESDPSTMFDKGNFKDMSLYLSGVNNPWSFDLAAQDAYQKKLETEKATQQAKAIAYQGFKGAGENGSNSTITNPGSLIKTNIANVQNIGNMALASATHPGEVISSLVSQVITQAIHQGFKSVQNAVSQQTNNVENKINEEIENSINTNGPGSRFKFSSF